MTEKNNIFETLAFIDSLDMSEFDYNAKWAISGIRSRLEKAYLESPMDRMTKEYVYFRDERTRLEKEDPDNLEEIERCNRKIRGLIKRLLDSDVTGSYRENE